MAGLWGSRAEKWTKFLCFLSQGGGEDTALSLLKTQRLASMLVRASIIPFLFRQELFEE